MQRRGLMWYVYRALKKAGQVVRALKICLLYGTHNYVKTYGKVYLDCRHIHFGRNVSIGANVRIFGMGEVVFENNAMIGDSTIICASNRITVGCDTMIAGQCYIVDCNHGMHMNDKMCRQPLSVGTVSIGQDVWIGCGCIVLKNSEIGDGAVIGAGTVVDGRIDEKTICYTERKYIVKLRN